MQLRTISYLLVALAAGACGTASDSTASTTLDNAGSSSKPDAEACRPSAPANLRRAPRAVGDDDHGKSDAGKGHADGDDDDDDGDDDDDEHEDGGKK